MVARARKLVLLLALAL